MGRIVDIIVDRSGQVRAAVIDFGGFLGVGSRKIAVDWSILRFGSGEKSDRVVVDLTWAQVKAAPEYKDGKQVVVLGARRRCRRVSLALRHPDSARPELRSSPEPAKAGGWIPGVDHASKFECKRPTEPSRASLRGLDWFTFFVADIQTSFGPFIAVYLTTQKWTLADIGLVLTIGSLVGLIGQMPGGAVVDAVRSERAQPPRRSSASV